MGGLPFAEPLSEDGGGTDPFRRLPPLVSSLVRRIKTVSLWVLDLIKELLVALRSGTGRLRADRTSWSMAAVLSVLIYRHREGALELLTAPLMWIYKLLRIANIDV